MDWPTTATMTRGVGVCSWICSVCSEEFWNFDDLKELPDRCPKCGSIVTEYVYEIEWSE